MWSPTHVQVTVQRARGLLTKGKNKSNDCFVTIALGKEKYQTSVKEKASESVEWHEECELQIPQQGNTAEIVLTALHRNFLGVDEFLGTVSIPLASFDVYERPRNRWYTLGHKPGKENTKERGELEVKIGFIVKAGSLTDLTRKERHKSSLGQLSTAAQSIGGSLLSIGSLEKRKGLKKFAKSIGNRVKGKSKSKLNEEELDEREEHRTVRPSRQEPGQADPGVISEDEDEFTFDDLSHKSSASSLNAPSVGAPITTGVSNYSPIISPKTNVKSSSSLSSSPTPQPQQPPPPPLPPLRATNEPFVASLSAPTNAAPNKPPRFSSSSPNGRKNDEEDEWGRKLYGKQPNSILKRWDNNKSSPKIIVDEPRNERQASPVGAASPTSRLRDEPPSPAPREIIHLKRHKDDKSSAKEKSPKDERPILREKSPKEEKSSKKDKKKDQRIKDTNEDGRDPSSERIIIGGEDAMKNTMSTDYNRLPHEVLAQFEGKSREDLIELTLQLQTEVTDKKKRLADLEEYIDALLLRVIECSPRLLQNPYQSRRLSSPGRQC